MYVSHMYWYGIVHKIKFIIVCNIVDHILLGCVFICISKRNNSIFLHISSQAHRKSWYMYTLEGTLSCFIHRDIQESTLKCVSNVILFY